MSRIYLVWGEKEIPGEYYPVDVLLKVFDSEQKANEYIKTFVDSHIDNLTYVEQEVE